jgi:hypothetical protein
MAIVPGLIAIQSGTKSWPFFLVVLAIIVGLVHRTARLRVELREEVFFCHRILPTRKIEFADLVRLEIDGSPTRRRITRVVAILRDGGRISLTYDQALSQPYAQYAEFSLQVNDRIREARERMQPGFGRRLCW